MYNARRPSALALAQSRILSWQACMHTLKGEELKPSCMQLSAQWQLIDPRQAPLPGDGSNPINESTGDKWQEVYLQSFMGGKYCRYWVVRT